MSEQTDTTCWFLLRSKSVGRNVSLSTDKDLSETIFRSFSSFLSLSLSLPSNRDKLENYSKTIRAGSKKSRIVSCNDNERPIGNFCSLNGTLVAECLKMIPR